MSEQRDSAAIYPIGAVEKQTGLTARQIRYYEKKGLVSPSRTTGNQRLYSRRDIERLRRISRLLEEGLPLESVRAVIDRDAAGGSPRPALETRRLPTENASDRDLWFKQSPLPNSIFPIKNQARMVELLLSRGADKDHDVKEN